MPVYPQLGSFSLTAIVLGDISYNGHHAYNMPEFKCGISNGHAHRKKKALRDVFVNRALQLSVNSIRDMAGEAKSAVKAERCSGCTCDPILTSKT